MNFILCLVYSLTIFATAQSLECFNCFEGSLLKNKNRLPGANDPNIARPTERCIRRDGELIGPKCHGRNVCIKSDTITDGDAAILRFCSAVDVPGIEKDVHQRSETGVVTSEVNMCLTDLCNNSPSIVYSASLVITLIMTVLLA